MNTTLEQIRDQLAHFERERSDHCQANAQMQGELATITADIRRDHHIPRDRFNKMLARQAELKRYLTTNTAKISELNPQIKRLNQLVSDLESAEYVAKRAVLKSDSSILGDLSELRTKYTKFGADNTRVSSMRLMATQFANELEAIIRKAS
jgi:hypothetical protein